MVERHRAGSTSGREGAQHRHISELLRERHERLDDPCTVACAVHAHNLTAAAVQVSGYLAHIFLRSNDFEAHDGFEENRTALAAGIAERLARCKFK